MAAKKEAPIREEPSSLFQRQRVDMLLVELTRKFPTPVPKPVQQIADSGIVKTIMNFNNIEHFIVSIS